MCGGFIADKFGAKRTVILAGALIAIDWIAFSRLEPMQSDWMAHGHGKQATVSGGPQVLQPPFALRTRSVHKNAFKTKTQMHSKRYSLYTTYAGKT